MTPPRALRPRLPARSRSRDSDAVRLPTSHSWTAYLDPTAWTVAVRSDGTGHIVPIVKTLQHRPGVAGVGVTRSDDGKRIGDPKVALDVLEGKGRVIIPHDTTVSAFGEEQPGYLTAYEVPGGRAHLWAWERPVPRAGGTDKERDDDARIDWLIKIGRELLGEPSRQVLAALKRMLTRAYIDNRVRADRSPPAAQATRNLRRKLEAMGWEVPAAAAAIDAQRAAPAAPASAPQRSMLEQLAAMSPEERETLRLLLNGPSAPAAPPTAAPAAAPAEPLPASPRPPRPPRPPTPATPPASPPAGSPASVESPPVSASGLSADADDQAEDDQPPGPARTLRSRP